MPVELFQNGLEDKNTDRREQLTQKDVKAKEEIVCEIFLLFKYVIARKCSIVLLEFSKSLVLLIK